jgi:hypothetical protein
VSQLIIVLLGSATVVFAFFAWRFWQQAETIRKRYAGISDIQAEVTAAQSKLDQTREAQKQFESESQQRHAMTIQES